MRRRRLAAVGEAPRLEDRVGRGARRRDARPALVRRERRGAGLEFDRARRGVTAVRNSRLRAPASPRRGLDGGCRTRQWEAEAAEVVAVGGRQRRDAGVGEVDDRVPLAGEGQRRVGLGAVEADDAVSQVLGPAGERPEQPAAERADGESVRRPRVGVVDVERALDVAVDLDRRVRRVGGEPLGRQATEEAREAGSLRGETRAPRAEGRAAANVDDARAHRLDLGVGRHVGP
mmetsp:Transcript_5746/g.23882  ORF Transcript_5746/g.23882 Transcript_5746/m.23882 type:complete len:232 (-) Transcript_5746:532-1227(-)